MSLESPSRSPAAQHMKDLQRRPRKPPPRPPPPNLSPERQQQRKVSSTGSVLSTPALCDRPIPQPRRRRSQDAAVSSTLLRDHSVAPAAPPPRAPPPPRDGKLSPSTTSPTKVRSPAPRPRSACNRSPPQGPSPRPRKRIIDTNVPQHFHTLPTRSHHKPPHKTLPVSTPSEDFSDHVYEKVKYNSPPVPPRPTQAALQSRKASPMSSRSFPSLSSMMVNKVTASEEEDQGIYTALLKEADTNDQDDYTPLNNYVTMQPSSMRCSTPPSNADQCQGMYMTIDRDTLDDNIYQVPNEDASTSSSTSDMYDIPRPVRSSSHCVHPVPVPRTALQHFTPQQNH